MVMRRKAFKWSRTEMIKRPDNILSSEYTNNVSRFIPAYEKDPVDMFLLMSMEYGRLWRKEKENAKQIVLLATDNDFLVRRYVKRGLLLRKKEEEKAKPFKMKRFENIPSRIRVNSNEVIEKMINKLPEDEKNRLYEEAKKK